MKLGVRNYNLSSTFCIAAACAAAMLSAGSSIASAKVLQARSFFNSGCSQGSCKIGGGACITTGNLNDGLHCACNTQMGSCALTN